MIRYLLRKIQADSSGAALVYTLLVTAVLMIAAVAIISVTGIDSKLVLAQEDKKIVQYAAESAVEVIRQQLISEDQAALETASSWTLWTSLPLGYIDCRYRFKVSPGPDQGQYLLEVQTKVTLDSGKKAEKDLELVIQYTLGKPGSDSIDDGDINLQPDEGTNPNTELEPQLVNSAVYDYALATGGSLNLVNWGTAIAGNVFSNSSIQLKGNEVAGVVKACGAIDVTDSQMPTFNIEPNQPLPLTMPVVNWDYSSHNSDTYKYSAGTTYIVRDLEIQNSIVNKIVYVFGNVQLPVAIPGNTLIVASGDIHIQGDSTLTMPKAGLIAGNNIYIEGPEQQDPSDESSQQDTGPEIHGLLLAGNNVITSGVSTIWGTVVAGNHFLPGKDRHVIYQDADAVEWVFQFVESVGRTRKDIIANYDDLNKSYLVTPAKKPGAEIENNHTTPDSHSTTGSSAGVPPEITIIRWKELN